MSNPIPGAPQTPPVNLATMQANPVPNGPFGRPPMNQCAQRAYKPATGAGSDGYGPSRVLPCNIAPAGRGLHAVEFAKDAGHSLRLAFPVDASNKLADFFKFIKETNGTSRVSMNAIVTSDFEGQHVLATYSGRDTDTDEKHAMYVAMGNPHNGVTLALPGADGTGRAILYYYWCDTPDGSAAKMPVAHSGSN